MNYWQERIIKTQEAVSKKSISAIEKQLIKYYRNSMKRTIADFEATYDKLMVGFISDIDPTPADLYKLDKYWQMQGQLQRELQRLGDKSISLLQSRFINTYLNVYENIALPSGLTYGKIDRALANQMINSIWCADGESWSSRIWKNTAKLSETLNEELINCVLGGKNTADLKNILQERFLVSYSQADSLVKTEIAHIQTQAAKKRYEDAGIAMVEVWADEDERRCEVCGKLHQTKYPVGSQMPVPAHPRCRCCIIPVIE